MTTVHMVAVVYDNITDCFWCLLDSNRQCISNFLHGDAANMHERGKYCSKYGAEAELRYPYLREKIELTECSLFH